MKAFTIPLVMTLSGGLAMAAEMPKASKKSEATSDKSAVTTMKGEVVSTDASANKLVLKTSSGEETLMVTGKAAEQLKSLGAGEKVTVKERNSEVFSIGVAKTKSKAHASASSHTAASASRKY